MSHVVQSPYLFEVLDKKRLFDPGSLWDAYDVQWSEDSLKLTMKMLHYPDGLRTLMLSLDLGNDAAALTFGEHTICSGSLSSVQKEMEKMGPWKV